MSLYITLNQTSESGLAVALVEAGTPQQAVDKRQEQLLPGLRVTAVSSRPVKADDMGSFFNEVALVESPKLTVGKRIKL